MLHQPSSRYPPRVHPEEIPSQQLADTKQHLCVNTVTVENAVAGHAAGVQLPRQPRHAASLRTQLLLDDVPDVDGF